MDNTTHPAGGSDELRSIDQALLLAIARTRGAAVPLTADQEQLLDDWLGNRLSEADADRAARLTRQNALAAERVLERRLVAAADAGPPVPPALTARVMKIGRSREPQPRSAFRFRWPALSRLQWSAAGAAVAATIVAGVLGLVSWQQNTLSNQRIQIAMVTIDDPRALSGGRQMRSLKMDGTTLATEGFRDIDIPVDVLRRAIGNADGTAPGSTASQLSEYLPPRPGTTEPSQIAIDSALATRLAGEWNGRVIAPVRAYDLDQPNMRAARENLNAQPGTVLLTVRR